MRRLGRLALVGLVLAIVGAVGLRGPGERAVRADAEAARRLVAEGKLQEAQPFLGRWRDARPRDGEPLYLLAKCAIQAQQVETGLVLLGQAEALGHPRDAIALQRGLALARLGRQQEAIPLLSRSARAVEPQPGGRRGLRVAIWRRTSLRPRPPSWAVGQGRSGQPQASLMEGGGGPPDRGRGRRARPRLRARPDARPRERRGRPSARRGVPEAPPDRRRETSLRRLP